VIHACRALLARGRRPGILSRGYGPHGPGGGNDEARVIAASLPDVPHGQDPDRLRAGLALQDRVDCYVLDDGFQHLPLHRDADVVLVDATAPFGGGWCPPAGRLREPLSALGRASLVILTRADLVTREELGATMRTVRAHTRAPIATARFVPSCTEDLAGVEATLACGIGNPHAFVRTAGQLGVRVAGTRFFRDHHAYTADDARALAAAGRPVVVTEKDAVKLVPLWDPAGVPLHVVRVQAELVEGGGEYEALLDRLCG